MNQQDATDLATRYYNTWPKGPAAYLWGDTFRDLDAGTVGTAWARLTKTEAHLTIPRFHETYNQLNTQDRSTRPDRGKCDTCEGHGWNHKETVNEHGHVTNHWAEPCHCPNGRDREQVHRQIADWNNNELDRLFPARHEPRHPRSNAA